MEHRLLYLCLVILESFTLIQAASLGGSGFDLSGAVGEVFDRSLEGDDSRESLGLFEQFDAHQFVGLPWNERVEETEKRINRKEALNYLQRFGYLDGDFSGLKGDELDLVLTPTLRKFQRVNSLVQTGKLDNSTRHLMAKPRCDFPDLLPSDPYRKKRYTLGQTKWSSTDLPIKIKFISYSSKMKRAEQEEAMRRAAKAWEKFSSLEFVFGNEPSKSTISIDFSNLDGLWGVLGRAWFPRVGKIMFEDGENWVPNTLTASSGKLSFQSVAMHELGHALGISHSNARESIMAAQYSRDVQDLKDDDIKAIQKLYGPPPRKPRPKPTSTTREPVNETSTKAKRRKNKGKGVAGRRKQKTTTVTATTTTTTTTTAATKKRRNKNNKNNRKDRTNNDENKTKKNKKKTKQATNKKSKTNNINTSNNDNNNDNNNNNDSNNKRNNKKNQRSRSLDLSNFFDI